MRQQAAYPESQVCFVLVSDDLSELSKDVQLYRCYCLPVSFWSALLQPSLQLSYDLVAHASSSQQTVWMFVMKMMVDCLERLMRDRLFLLSFWKEKFVAQEINAFRLALSLSTQCLRFDCDLSYGWGATFSAAHLISLNLPVLWRAQPDLLSCAV